MCDSEDGKRSEWMEKNLLQTLRAARLAAVCVWAEPHQRHATHRRVSRWFTWGDFCTSGSASQSVSRSCRPSQKASCCRCPSPSIGSLRTRKCRYTQITRSFILPQEYVVCVFRTDKMPNPSSPAGLWGWRAGVHGRASLAVRTGWPTGLAARPVKDTTHTGS